MRVAWAASVVAGPWAAWGLTAGYTLVLYRLAAELAASYGQDPRDPDFRRALRRVVYEGLYGGRPQAAHHHLSPYVRRVRRWVRPTLKVWTLVDGSLWLWDLNRSHQERRRAEAAARRLHAFVRARSGPGL